MGRSRDPSMMAGMGTRRPSPAARRRLMCAVLVPAALALAACTDDAEIPGVQPQPTRTASTQASAAAEIPGVGITATPRPTCSDGAATACLDDALAAEQRALKAAGTDAAAAKLTELDRLPGSLDGALTALAGYEWTSETARTRYEQAKTLRGGG